MQLSLFDYHLDDSLIAREPAAVRDEAALMIVDRKTDLLEEKQVKNIIEYLDAGDVLVLNETKVFPARLFGAKDTGGKVEVLLHKQIGMGVFEVLTKPGVKDGTTIHFEKMKARVLEHKEQMSILQFDVKGSEFEKIVEEIGKTPLPPYIHTSLNEKEAREKYQTVYAKLTGSVAAPTAGLHFTEELLKQIEDRGVKIVKVWLHVGLGTFAGVKTDDIRDHAMHEESYELDAEAAEIINQAKMQGKKITAVGTTSVRVLESCVGSDGLVRAAKGETKIFIYPAYKFRVVDQLLTNFHLPKSTLLMLVSALVSAPNTKHEFESFEKTLVGKAYLKAIGEQWRFFSFGDAMLIL